MDHQKWIFWAAQTRVPVFFFFFLISADTYQTNSLTWVPMALVWKECFFYCDQSLCCQLNIYIDNVWNSKPAFPRRYCNCNFFLNGKEKVSFWESHCSTCVGRSLRLLLSKLPPSFKWHCVKTLIGEWGDKTHCRKLLFLFLLILAVQVVQTAKHYSRDITRNPRDRANHFELLMLKHHQSFSSYEFGRKYVSDNEI